MTEYIVLRETPGVDSPSCEIVDGKRTATNALAACRAVALELDEDVVLYAVPIRNWRRHAFGVETQRRLVAR